MISIVVYPGHAGRDDPSISPAKALSERSGDCFLRCERGIRCTCFHASHLRIRPSHSNARWDT